MEHVRPIDLIQLAANDLAAPRRAEIEQHLSRCPDCRSQYERQSAVWNTLGEWGLESPTGDPSAGIGRRLTARSTEQSAFLLHVRRISRIAAAIIVGTGVGYVAGSARPPAVPQPAPEISAALEKEAADTLGASFLTAPSPAGLYAALVDIEADNEGAEGES